MKNRVRELREAKGLSQIELARKIQAKQAFISKIETGRQVMSPEQMQSLAKVLEVHPSELIDDPLWNRPNKLDENLLRTISESVMRARTRYPALNDNLAAAVIASLYKRYAQTHGDKPVQARHVDELADVLVSHEIDKSRAMQTSKK